jgi:hypothetical protein
MSTASWVGACSALMVAASVLAGCARHTVVNPDDVDENNDRDWRIQWARPVSSAPAPNAVDARAPKAPDQR